MVVQRTPIVGITRTPVVGIQRTPITGIERKPITQGEPLNWDEIYKNLVNYIKFAAKQVGSQYGVSGYLSTEDLFQEGQLLLYHCYTVYQYKPMNEFEALFKTSLWRKLREIGRKPQFNTVDIEDAYDIGYSDDVTETIYEEFKLQQMAEMLESSPIALTILKEFINPSSRTLWEASMDVARKQMLQDQDYNIAVPKSIAVKGVHIQRALEIPKNMFAENFQRVKQVVGTVYSIGEDEDFENFDEALQKAM